MFDERAGKTWTRGEGSRGLRDGQFCAGERGIGNFVQERERVGEESVSRRHITLLPNDPAFSNAVWSPSSICSMPSLKIEVLCMLGCKEAQARVVAV